MTHRYRSTSPISHHFKRRDFPMLVAPMSPLPTARNVKHAFLLCEMRVEKARERVLEAALRSPGCPGLRSPPDSYAYARTPSNGTQAGGWGVPSPHHLMREAGSEMIGSAERRQQARRSASPSSAHSPSARSVRRSRSRGVGGVTKHKGRTVHTAYGNNAFGRSRAGAMWNSRPVLSRPAQIDDTLLTRHEMTPYQRKQARERAEKRRLHSDSVEAQQKRASGALQERPVYVAAPVAATPLSESPSAAMARARMRYGEEERHHAMTGAPRVSETAYEGSRCGSPTNSPIEAGRSNASPSRNRSLSPGPSGPVSGSFFGAALQPRAVGEPMSASRGVQMRARANKKSSNRGLSAHQRVQQQHALSTRRSSTSPAVSPWERTGSRGRSPLMSGRRPRLGRPSSRGSALGSGGSAPLRSIVLAQGGESCDFSTAMLRSRSRSRSPSGRLRSPASRLAAQYSRADLSSRGSYRVPPSREGRAASRESRRIRVLSPTSTGRPCSRGSPTRDVIDQLAAALTSSPSPRCALFNAPPLSVHAVWDCGAVSSSRRSLARPPSLHPSLPSPSPSPQAGQHSL